MLRPVGTNKPVSGLIRLTCPHLVSAVDEVEAEGGVARMNEELNYGTRGPEWQDALKAVNDAHRELRRALTSEAEVEQVKERFGEKGAESFFNRCTHASCSTSPSKPCLAFARSSKHLLSCQIARSHARGSGIAGMSPTKLDDVKCLHAHLADSLVRGADNNVIGRAVQDELKSRGVCVGGSNVCHQQCDVNRAETRELVSYRQ